MTPEARALTLDYRRRTLAVAELIRRQVGRMGRQADTGDIDRWWEGRSVEVERLVRQGAITTAELAAQYAADHARLEGVAVAAEIVTPAPLVVAESLRITGPVAFKTAMVRTNGEPSRARAIMATRLSGAAVRQTLAGSRDTTTATAQTNDTVAGWRRVGSGTPCDFCAMIISRGAAYKESTALRSPEFHDHDRCLYEPLYRRQAEPASVLRLRRQWEEATDGVDPSSQLAAFRRARAAGDT